MQPRYPDLLGKHIVFFDGECAFCNQAVKFYCARDLKDQLRFAPLQGQFAISELARHDVGSRELRSGLTDSSMLQDYFVLEAFGTANERLLWRGQATSLLLRTIGGGWALLGSVLRLVPRPLVDSVYRIISLNRYRWFGKEQACDLPTPALIKRLIG
jgi:predicted DCC family thiol-disulfide oxidoreductase YuxK